MLPLATRRVWTIAVTCAFFIFTCYLWTPSPWSTFLRPETQALSGPEFGSAPGASNDTLGFGVIYVLTEDPTTWRVQGLLRAANLTGLLIQVPVQKHLPENEVRAKVDKELPEGYGSTRALLNHLAILETFSKSHFETALILEDDVDFGINIRAQMNRLSQAFWDHARESRTTEQAVLHPYRESEWDILWPGHYGMSFVQGSDIFKYEDRYALPWSHLTSQFNDYYEQMADLSKKGRPEPQQLIFNVAPLATFAYAITRTHAARLVQKILVEGVHRKAGTPYDTALNIDCTGLGQRCVAPVPQLFHHHRVVGEASISTVGNKEEGHQDMSWYQKKHKYSYNIEWSARCNAAHVGELIGDRWQCLPGKYDPL